jgi:hypothetical protein
MSGVFLIACGVVVLGWTQWYVPRAMDRVRQRVVDRGGDPAALDARLTSRTWRRLMIASWAVGAVAILGGVLFLITGE